MDPGRLLMGLEYTVLRSTQIDLADNLVYVGKPNFLLIC